MLLKDVRIQDYRSVEDSGTVPIEIDVTCLVGKNESGPITEKILRETREC